MTAKGNPFLSAPFPLMPCCTFPRSTQTQTCDLGSLNDSQRLLLLQIAMKVADIGHAAESHDVHIRCVCVCVCAPHAVCAVRACVRACIHAECVH